MQVHITINNVVAVSYNLSDLITSTTDTADQNTDNIIVVSAILNQTASLLSDSTILTALSHEEVSMVWMQYFAVWLIILKTTENTMQILDNIEEWPPNVVETESNKWAKSTIIVLNEIMFNDRMVKSFERTVDALLSQGNFTNTSLAANDIVLRGEKVSKLVIFSEGWLKF